MSGVNKVILVGNLGADPELKSTTGGQQVAQLRVAVNESWTDKAGARQERTEWVRVVAWGRLADLCSQYLAKGRQVYVEGRLQTREWTDKENRRQFTTEVVAQNVVFLGGGKGTSSEQAAGWSETEAEAVGTAPARAARAAVSDAEIPF